MRGRQHLHPTQFGFLSPADEDDDVNGQNTIRAPTALASAHTPSSLRSIFGELNVDPPPPEPSYSLLQASATPATYSPVVEPPLMFQETVTEEEEGVSFEPSKPLMPPPELVTPKWSDLPPLGRGIPRGNAPSRPEPYSRTASPNSMRSGQTLHEYRTSRALPNIDIPLSSSPQPPSQSSAGSSYSHNSSHSTTPPPAIRGHPSTVIKPHVDSASTSSTTPPQTLRIHSRIASHESGSSTHGTSPSAHQTTYSLDITKHSWRSPEHLPTASPISRTRSATTIIDASSPSSVLRPGPFGFKPSDSPPLPMPIKPFARSVRERSGSVDSENTTFSLGLPGLKDVLKVSSFRVLSFCVRYLIFSLSRSLPSHQNINWACQTYFPHRPP